MSQKPRIKECPSCKSDNVEEYDGILVCENCGLVLEEHNLRFEVELHSTSGKNGQHIKPVGSIVSSMEARTDLASSSGLSSNNTRRVMYGFGDTAKVIDAH